MFKVFVIVFLASGGPPIGHSKSHFTTDTLEECRGYLTSTDASDPKALAAGKAALEAQVGQALRLAATCAEVDEAGDPVNQAELPSAAEQN
jgi:hypothetical protein